MPNLFFAATLCLLNLSSGEKRAGCADSVTFPSGFDFYLVFVCAAHRIKLLIGFSNRVDTFTRCRTVSNTVI